MNYSKEFIMSLLKMDRVRGIDVDRIQNAAIYEPTSYLPQYHEHIASYGIFSMNLNSDSVL